MGRRRATVFATLIGLLVVAALFAFVYPTRTYLAQRDELRTAEQRLHVLREQTRELEHAASRLKNDDEVEKIARRDYGLVRPGETPYVIVPTPTTNPATSSP